MTNHPSLEPRLARSNVTTLIAGIKSLEAPPLTDVENFEPEAAYLSGYERGRLDAIGEIALMWHAANIATAATQAALEKDLKKILETPKFSTDEGN